MVAAVDSMAYAGEVPWHGLGVPVSDDLTPKEMLVKAGCDWQLGFRELHYRNLEDEVVPWEGGSETEGPHKALVRLHDGEQYDIVGPRWKIVQNEEAVEFFAKFVQAGSMKMHTLGSLWDGRYIWALASIEKDFNVGGKGKQADKIGGYLLLALPHVNGKAMLFKFTTIRVVCWNTFSAAIGTWGRQKTEKGKLFKMPHSVAWNDVSKARAEECLNLATEQFDEFAEQAKLLAKAKLTPEAALEYFCDVYQATPQGSNWDRKQAVKDENYPDVIDKFQLALLKSPGHDLNSAHGTLWGAFNAITYVSDHEYGKAADTRLHSSWLGPKAGMKIKALDIAIEKAKVLV